jgi:hypothetical protein
MSVAWGGNDQARLQGDSRKYDSTLDDRAIRLAKIALVWAEMSAEEQMRNLSALALRAQQIKETL